MTKPAIRIAGATLMSCLALCAQSLTGTWQGSLHVGKDLRMVVKIATSDKDSMKGTFYSIDQSPQPIPVSGISLQGGAVKFSIPGIGGAYEGKMNAEGNFITGTFNQGPAKLPLDLSKATPETAWTIPEPPAAPKPMRADANPAFEVATIKPSKPGQQGKAITMQGRKILTINTNLVDLISFAWELNPRQITGGPAWKEDDRYDVVGEPDEAGQPSLAQMKTMMRKLLADRFALTYHNEKKELSAYAITVAKGGPKLTRSEGDPNGLPSLSIPALGLLPARNANMANLAMLLQGAVLDRPVVDQTGLAGRWDFTLKWTPDPTQFAGMGFKIPQPSDDPTAPPDLFAAFVQQLGLKLESVKTPVDTLVIDKVLKPSDN